MKEDILKKSLQLFVKNGFKSITMDDIAKEMAISKKTIYQHFDSKYDLVAATVDYVFDSTASQMEKFIGTSETPIHEHYAMKGCVADLFGHNIEPSAIYQFNKYFPKIAQKIDEKRKAGFERTILRNLKEGVELGLYRSEIDVEFIGRMFFQSSASFFHDDIFEELLKVNTMDELNMKTLEYHLRGIVTPKGLEVLEQILKEIN